MFEEVIRFALLGFGVGALYALASQGLIVIYRGAGVLNFALGAIGMVGVYLQWELHTNYDVPFLLSAVAGIATSAAIGALTHLLIMRQLWQVSPIVRVIATLGVLITLQSLAILRYGSNAIVVSSDLPTTTWRLSEGIVISADRVLLLLIAAAVSAALWALYRYTRFGLGTTAVAENQRAAASLGWSPDTIAAVNWALGCGLAGLAAILIAPIVTLQPTVMTNLILAATAAALVAGFHSFPIAFAAGLAIGIAQTEINRFVAAPGVGQAVPFVLIVVWLIARGQALPLRDFVLQRLPSIGNGRVHGVATAVAVAVVLVLLTTSNLQWVAAITTTMLTAIVLLSIVVLTGYTGQLSLAQFALAGFGAWVAGRLEATTGISFWLALLAGVAATVPVGVLLALPAVKTRGINLAIVTLGLGTALELVLFRNRDYTGGVSGTQVAKPTLFGADISAVGEPVRWGVLALVFLVLTTLMVSNVRRGQSGRQMIAVRTNERAAAALGISVIGVKLYAFALSAGIAALGGVLLAYQSTSINYGTFDSFSSISAVGFTLLGGIGFLVGPIIGATMAPGGFNAQLFNEFGTGFGRYVPLIGGVAIILLILLNQNGIAKETISQIRWVRARLGRRVPRLAERPASPIELPDAPPRRVPALTLVADGVTVRYGGTVAVDGVSLRVEPGRVVGLIGPNGAGKTSFIDAVTGFAPLSSGRLRLGEQDVSSLSPVRRARAGLGRSFQSLELFEDSTVIENLRVAADKPNGLAYLRDLVRPSREPLPPNAVSAIREFELESSLNRQVEDLSYGERRLLAIARAVAAGPSVLLLDEPAAGLGDKETAELAHLVRRLADESGMAILLVEHDMNFVMSVCDELVVLDFGRMISSGTPEAVRADPAVIAAYLGVEEEDVHAPTGPGRATVENSPGGTR
ncbi:MAG TPA: branched-chain amino acid ABC transporter permease/ATP-binding protein [Egibacteraceae bacterium]|nr:branched-chain amino acid ABC transporter permease/ATP-binding protein [Egibacteraceae bacterium]